jgi:hypothetical protein
LFQEEQEALEDRRLHRLGRVRAHAVLKRLIDVCGSVGKPSREQHELCLMRRGVPRVGRQLQFLGQTGVALQVPTRWTDFTARELGFVANGQPVGQVLPCSSLF